MAAPTYAMRITGGQLGSRALKAPKGTVTRPTSDRVREALFNILRDDCAGARVLDLYAGTGALGLEAISRGAVFAVFVERSKEALAALNANIAALCLGGRTRVIPLPLERAAKDLGRRKDTPEPFDLVFADPPYADVTSGEAVRAIVALLVPEVFAPDGRLILEHAHRDPAPAIDGFALDETRTYGDTSLSFYAPRFHSGG